MDFGRENILQYTGGPGDPGGLGGPCGPDGQVVQVINVDRVIRVARVVWVVREGRSKGYKWSRLSRWLALMIAFRKCMVYMV